MKPQWDEQTRQEAAASPWVADEVWDALDAARRNLDALEPKETLADAHARRAEMDRQMAAAAEIQRMVDEDTSKQAAGVL